VILVNICMYINYGRFQQILFYFKSVMNENKFTSFFSPFLLCNYITVHKCFCCDAGSVPDPCHFRVEPEPDPGPAIFVIDLQDTNKKLI
jgi:hypothetical protein